MRDPRAQYANPPRLPEGDEVLLAEFLPGNEPLELEIGPGRGMFILERAVAAPDARLLGMEIKRKWSTIVDERLRAKGFGGRARVVCEEGRAASTATRGERRAGIRARPRPVVEEAARQAHGPR